MSRIKHDQLPKYRLHKVSGHAIVTLNGRDHYLGAHGTPESRQNYDRLIAEWVANGRRSPAEAGQAEPITIVELCAKYWEHAKGYYVKNGKATSEQGAIKTALRIAKGLFPYLPATEFGP